MSLRGSVRPAIDRGTIGLLVVAVFVVLLQWLATFALTAYAGSYHRLVAPIVSLVGTWLLIVVLLPLLAGLYVPAYRNCETPRETVRTALAGIREYYRPLLANAAVVLCLTLVVMAFAMSLLIVSDTVITYWSHVSGDPRPPATLGLFEPLVFAAMVGFGVAVVVLQFADVAVVYADVPPRLAWRESLRFTRRHPVTVLGVTAISAVLGWIPLQVPQLIDPYQSPNGFLVQPALSDFVVPLLVACIVGALCLTGVALLRLTVYQRTREDPVAGSHAWPQLPWRGIVLSSIVVLAAVGGAIAVRSMDFGVQQESIEPLPEDPGIAYDIAAANTANASHRAVTTMKNHSDDTSNWIPIQNSTIDYDDRQQRYTLYNDGTKSADSYFSESLLATWAAENDFSFRGLEPLTRRVGNWSVTMGSGYGVVRQRQYYRLPSAGLNWSVQGANESRIVYRIDSVSELTATDRDLFRQSGGLNLSRNSFAVTVVDRDSGTIETVRYHYEWTDTGITHDYVTKYEDVGSVDLERPAAFGPRRPLEYFWDALYY